MKFNYKNDKEDEHLGFISEEVLKPTASKDRKGMSPMDVLAALNKVEQEQPEAFKSHHKALKEPQKTIHEFHKMISNLEKTSQ